MFLFSDLRRYWLLIGRLESCKCVLFGCGMMFGSWLRLFIYMVVSGVLLRSKLRREIFILSVFGISRFFVIRCVCLSKIFLSKLVCYGD